MSEFTVKTLHRLPRSEVYGDGALIAPLVDAGVLPGVGLDYVVIPPAECQPPHIHQRATSVLIIVGGVGILTIGDQKIEVHPNQIITIPAGVRHTLRAQHEQFSFFEIQSPPVRAQDGTLDMKIIT